MFRYTPATLQKLEHLYREGEYLVRYEKGNFKSGYCILQDKKVVVINKYFDTESRINSLLDILSMVNLDDAKLSDASLQFLEHVKEIRVKS
jgi:hypothetical protein